MEYHPYKIDESDVMTRIIGCMRSSAIFKEPAHGWGYCINSRLGLSHHRPILYCLRLSVVLREAVETKVTVDSKRTNERGPFLVDTLCFLCSVLAAQIGPVQNIFFLTIHFFPFLCPLHPASWAGSRTGSPSTLQIGDLRTQSFL
jgi:hypothetical protein